ncbi:MAG: hypothetical protein ACYSWP_12260 [Planctomycetota bacterium]|jgi:hypothetical protein
MNTEPPEGSRINVERDSYSTTYTWTNGEKNIGQYATAAFLTFWLCGWTVGGFMAATMLFSNNDMPIFARLFMLFWLGGWACGEAFAIYSIYNTFKPLKPAKLILSSTYCEYETGTTPFNFSRYNRDNYPQEKPKMFRSYRNKSYRLELGNMVNLQLERIGERQRLTFDMAAERIEIGEVLSEPEREWLYEVIKNSFLKL